MKELPVKVIAAGDGFTLIVSTAVPPLVTYDTVVAPAVTPVNTPAEFIVATDPELQLHVPPDEVSLYKVGTPIHTADGPVIGAGAWANTLMDKINASNVRERFFINFLFKFFIRKG